MAIETERKLGRKLIKLPNSQSKIPVPCIMEITFLDPVRRQQEIKFTHDNSENADREIHVDAVQSIDQNGDPNGPDELQVERIDKWKTRDPVRRNQDTEFSPDNKTGNDEKPPHFSTHKKTHVVRYYEDPENKAGSWVDVEWIDEYEDVDPVRRQQGRIFALTNVDDQADPNDPDITGAQDSGIDPPWRLSPWQNIVNWSGTPPLITLCLGVQLFGTVANIGSPCTACASPEPPGTPHLGTDPSNQYAITAEVKGSASLNPADGSGWSTPTGTGLLNYAPFERPGIAINPPDPNAPGAIQTGNLHVTIAGNKLSATWQLLADTRADGPYCNEYGCLVITKITSPQEQLGSGSFSLPATIIYKGKTYNRLTAFDGAGHPPTSICASYERQDPTA